MSHPPAAPPRSCPRSPRARLSTAGKYTVARFAGRKVAETSAVGSFRRPAQPLVLNEFQSCPFCRKVRLLTSHQRMHTELG